MNRSLCVLARLAVVILLAACSPAYAQQPAPPTDPAAKPAAAPTTKSPYRQLAPGVMQSVNPMQVLGETESRPYHTGSPHDVVELLAIDPKFPGAKNVPFRRDVWVLDFKFKPVRMIWVDIPQPSGLMQRKLIWYMVYWVTNTGKALHPVEDVNLSYDTFDKRQLYEVKTEDQPVRFVPSSCWRAISTWRTIRASPRSTPTA